MFMKVYRFFNKMINSMIYYIICIVLAISITSCYFYINSSDFIPAKDNDYEELISIKDEISNDFSKIYNYNNYNITPYNGNMILVTLKNDKCTLKCYFKKDLSIENYENSSNHRPIVLTILFFVIMSFIIFIALFLITILIGITIECIAEKKYNL